MPFIKTIVVAALFGLAAFFGIKKYTALREESRQERDALRLKLEFVERSSWLRNVPTADAYEQGVASTFKWYFTEVDEFVRRYRLNANFDDYLSELKATSKGEGDPRLAAYKLTRTYFDLFRSKRYTPMWTGTSNGIRFDIVSGEVEQVNGEKKIHLPIVLWGFPRTESVNEMGVRRISSNAQFTGKWRLLDAKGEQLGEIPISGGPTGRIEWPERFIAQFPPGMLLGYYDVDLLPAEVAKIEMTMSFTGSAPSGGDVFTQYQWNLDTPMAWKLPAGQQWNNAETRPREATAPAAPAKKAKRR